MLQKVFSVIKSKARNKNQKQRDEKVYIPVSVRRTKLHNFNIKPRFLILFIWSQTSKNKVKATLSSRDEFHENSYQQRHRQNIVISINIGIHGARSRDEENESKKCNIANCEKAANATDLIKEFGSVVALGIVGHDTNS